MMLRDALGQTARTTAGKPIGVGQVARRALAAAFLVAVVAGQPATLRTATGLTERVGPTNSAARSAAADILGNASSSAPVVTRVALANTTTHIAVFIRTAAVRSAA